MRARLRGLVVLVAACSLVAAACSSDPEPSDDDTTPETTIDGPVVKIGVLAPIDGGMTEFGRGIANSVQLAVDQANERDAIPGWTIVTEIVDDASDPDLGAEGARSLIDDPDVLGVVGPANSEVAQAVLPVFSQANMPVISPSNTLAELTRGTVVAAPARQFDNYFRMVATDAEQGPFLARYAYDELGVRRAAVVSETNNFSANRADAFAATFTELGGEVVVRTTLADGADDFTRFIAESATVEPDVVFVGSEWEFAAELRTQATGAGLTVPIVGGDGMKDDAYIENAGTETIGDVASTLGAPPGNLVSAAVFLAAYEEAGFDDPPHDYGAFAYDATGVLIEAIASELADEDTIPEGVRAALIPLIGAIRHQGVTGEVSFDEYGDTMNRLLSVFVVAEGDDSESGPVWEFVATANV